MEYTRIDPRNLFVQYNSSPFWSIISSDYVRGEMVIEHGNGEVKTVSMDDPLLKIAVLAENLETPNGNCCMMCDQPISKDWRKNSLEPRDARRMKEHASHASVETTERFYSDKMGGTANAKS